MTVKKIVSHKSLENKIVQEIIDKLNDYFKRSYTEGEKVHNYKTNEELTSLFGFPIQNTSKDFDWLKAVTDTFLQHTINTAHPFFSNQLFANVNDIALLGDMLASATNTSMAVYESAPIAYNMERSVVRLILGRLGYADDPDHGDGIMTPGGSYSNMQAILAARNYLFPETKQSGNLPGLVAFASDLAHYSLGKSANIIGIGEGCVRYVKTDADGTMNADDLKTKIETEKHNGNLPFFLLLTAGTTEFGSFDNIKLLTEIAKQHNIWVHVDGAWGGAVAFSRSKRARLQGIERTDSFSWDAHKVLGIPLYASFFMINKPLGTMEQLFGIGKGDYLFHGDSMDLGKKSLQCARRNDVLKVWLLFKFFGVEVVENTFENLFAKSREFAEIVKSDDRFELVMEPDYLNVCFRVKNPTQLSNVDFLKTIRNNLKEEGFYFVNYTARNEEDCFFRLITNLLITRENFVGFLERIASEVKK
ncbi:MAG: hypothetical protein F6K17_33950 [Okeania sp. SIO3C4]|nr:hypothetical protein [Okeania sp. SIO3C4]